MLYATRAIAYALGVSIYTVRNDFARGLIVHAFKDRHSNWFSLSECLHYRSYKSASMKVPSEREYARRLRRANGHCLTKAYGLTQAAKAIGTSPSTLARNNYNYRKMVRTTNG